MYNKGTNLLKNKEYSLKQQAIYLGTGKTLVFLLRFVLPVLLVRLMTTDNYGIYRQLLLVGAFFLPILQGGFTNSLFYFFPISKDRTQLLSQTILTITLISICFLPIFFLFKNQIGDFFQHDKFLEYVIPLGIYIVFSSISYLSEYVFVLEKRSNLVIVFLILNEILRILCIILPFLYFETIIAIIWGLVCWGVIKTLVLYCYLIVVYRINFKIKTWNYRYLRDQMKYALPMGMARVIGDLGRKVDQFILVALLSPVNFAIYSVARLQIPIVSIFFQSIRNVSIPKLSEHFTNNNYNAARELWHKIISHYAAIVIPAIVFFFIFSEKIIIILYTKNYIESVNLYRIVLLIPLFEIFGHGLMLRAFKETRAIMNANLLVIPISIPLGIILIKLFGNYGAAVTAVSAFYLNGLMQLSKTRKILNLKMGGLLPWLAILKILLLSMILAPVIYYLNLVKNTYIVSIILGTIIYFPFTIILILIIVIKEKTVMSYYNTVKQKLSI
ncbi:lipopolysaccharide biosynthesis protein [Calditrichota bacterium]